eukprot:403335617
MNIIAQQQTSNFDIVFSKHIQAHQSMFQVTKENFCDVSAVYKWQYKQPISHFKFQLKIKIKLLLQPVIHKNEEIKADQSIQEKDLQDLSNESLYFDKSDFQQIFDEPVLDQEYTVLLQLLLAFSYSVLRAQEGDFKYKHIVLINGIMKALIPTIQISYVSQVSSTSIKAVPSSNCWDYANEVLSLLLVNDFDGSSLQSYQNFLNGYRVRSSKLQRFQELTQRIIGNLQYASSELRGLAKQSLFGLVSLFKCASNQAQQCQHQIQRQYIMISMQNEELSFSSAQKLDESLKLSMLVHDLQAQIPVSIVDSNQSQNAVNQQVQIPQLSPCLLKIITQQANAYKRADLSSSSLTNRGVFERLKSKEMSMSDFD